MNPENPDLDEHLTDAELFALAAPAAGEPEALPRHVLSCRTCSRSLQEWKAAVRALADEDAGEIGRRTAEQWSAAEDATIAALRRAAPGRRPSRRLRWAIAVAASLLLAALLLPLRRHAPPRVAAVPTPSVAAAGSDSELTPADQADDELLRQASYLASGGDLDNDVPVEGRL